MRVYFAVTAEEYPEAADSTNGAVGTINSAADTTGGAAGTKNTAGKWTDTGRKFAYVAYRIGEQSMLLRGNLPLQTRGGLLSVSDRDAPPVEDPDALSGAVARECGRRGCTGAVLDFEAAPREDLRVFASRLSRRMRESGRKVYLPAAYAQTVPDAVRLINTAVSGGNFREYMEEAVLNAGGPDKTALDVQRLRMDFPLPAPTGEGEALSAEAFAELSKGKAVFFSPDLCARYFTFTRHIPAGTASDGQSVRAQGGEAHFVLFDDADTLNMKLRTGAELGVNTAFFMWPEVRDLASGLRW